MRTLTYPNDPKQQTVNNLCIVARTRGVTFSKAVAAKFVGGRSRLEALVAEKKIRTIKPGDRQNSRWECNAEEVLRYAMIVV